MNQKTQLKQRHHENFSIWYVMGLFGCLAVFLSISLAFIGLGVLIELNGEFFSHAIGGFGLYLAIFLLIGSLAFLTKIKGLNDIAAWFIGLIVFFG